MYAPVYFIKMKSNIISPINYGLLFCQILKTPIDCFPLKNERILQPELWEQLQTYSYNPTLLKVEI